MHGKTLSSKPKNNVQKKSVWFDSTCKHAKNLIIVTKELLKLSRLMKIEPGFFT
jgi:hypothetical protein